MDGKSKTIVRSESSCVCGGVEVRVNGPVRSMILCACLDCQRATGTGHSTVALFKRDDVTVSGDTRAFTRPAASGATFTQRFCPVCGTAICGASSRAEALVMLPVGLFGHDSDWFVPNQLIFARSHHDWDLIEAALPHHDTYRGETL
ncbi:GFA family protein [Devosia sp.]|uniref:GFA family protein n=1 Tax=Devosia sp. TaxID=1871048 RepID=UPI003A94FE04